MEGWMATRAPTSPRSRLVYLTSAHIITSPRYRFSPPSRPETNGAEERDAIIVFAIVVLEEEGWEDEKTERDDGEDEEEGVREDGEGGREEEEKEEKA